MSLDNFIPLNNLCTHYKVEMSFFDSLNEMGLIEIVTIEQTHFLQKEKASDIDKIIRIHQDLNINIEGIDTIFNLLDKIDTLQSKLITVQNRLRLYED